MHEVSGRAALGDTVLREDADGVRVLTMNRPEKLNALNTELTETLLAELEVAGRDPEIRAIVLTGAGRGFCAGADVTEFGHLTADNPREIKARGDLTMRLHASFVTIDTPIICAINGVAMGGGCGLAVAGDMAVPLMATASPCSTVTSMNSGVSGASSGWTVRWNT